MVEEHDMSGKVEFIGRVFQEDIIDYYQDADLFVLTSVRENLPNVLVESMALDVPVIATRIAAIPELIEDNVNGVLIDPGDVTSLVDNIKKLAKNPQRRREIARNGRETIVARFNEKNALEKLEIIYKSYWVC